MSRSKYLRVAAFSMALAMTFGSVHVTAFAADSGAPDGEAVLLYPYQDTTLPFAERAADLVSRMTLEEKQLQVRSSEAPAIPRLGVRQYNWWSEGLHGVARDGEATSFPTGLGIAATWDTALVEQMMQVTSDEAREKFNNHDNSHGLSYWSPTINLSRDPRWGRAEEAYGEDPYLTAQIGNAFVKGMQGSEDYYENDGYLKVIATSKHFMANNSESNRHTGSSDMSEQDLREYYSYAFKSAVEDAKVGSIMTSYNAVNGTPMAVNEEIMDGLLRWTWGFDGYVVTDCSALEDLESNRDWRPDGWDDSQPWDNKAIIATALNAGMDLNCRGYKTAQIGDAIESGLMTEDTLDRALVRLFTARMMTGEFDPADMVPYAGAEYQRGTQINAADHQQLAETSADNAVVLLKNEPAAGEQEKILPLKAVDSLVLIGDLADTVTLGDYSTNKPVSTSTIRQGVEAALKRANPDAAFTYIPGTTQSQAEYMMNVSNIKLHYADGTEKTVDLTKNSGVSGCEIEVGKSPVNIGRSKGTTAWVKFDAGVVDFHGVTSVSVQMSGAANAAETKFTIRAQNPTTGPEMISVSGKGNTGGWTTWDTLTANYSTGGYEDEDIYFVLDRVQKGAGFTAEEKEQIRNADAVVFFAATNPGENGYKENSDGYNLDFPRDQAATIDTVVSLNPKTVVYMQTVSQMNVEPFKDKVPAMLWSTYNGQAQGNAAGRLLFGEANPSAKLPFTWYTDVEQLPDVHDYSIRSSDTSNGRTYQYFTGDVTYPFGYGLSYSSFTYSNLAIDRSEVTPNDSITVTFDVTNTGDVAGQEVAQVYVVSPGADKQDRPAKRLKGFDKKEIAPGATEQFSITLPMEDLWYWDEEKGCQVYDEGQYTIQVGGDSQSCANNEAAFTLSGQLDRQLHVATAMPSGHILDTAAPDKTITTDLSAAYNDQTFANLEELTVQYESSDPSVAAVNETGVVTAVGGGTATITATVTADGHSVSDSFPVVVKETIAATGITVDGKPLEEFAPSKTEYEVYAASFDPMPVVAATAAEGVEVQVQQATAENPVATVTLTKGRITVVYTITLRLIPEPLKGMDFTTVTKDEFQSAWKVMRENDQKWTLDQNGLTIGTEYGDLHNASNNAKNMFYQETMGDWEVQTEIELDRIPNENYQQVALIAYQDDDNYVKMGYQGRTTGAKAVALNVEKNGTFQSPAPFEQKLETSKIWLQLKKTGDRYTGSFSTDGVNFTELGTVQNALKNVKLVMTANNGTGTTASEMQAVFKSFDVIGAVESVSLDKTELTLVEGASAELHATVLPENAADKTVTWTTTDERVATVDSEGKVTAVAAGTATITAAAGGQSATCTVTVTAAGEEPVCSADAAIRVLPKRDGEYAVFELSLKDAKNIAAVQVTFQAPAGAVIEAKSGFTYLDPTVHTLADGMQEYTAVLCYLEDQTFSAEGDSVVAAIKVAGATPTVTIEEVLIASYDENGEPAFGEAVDLINDTATYHSYDLNGDGKVDLLDIVVAMKFYQSKAGDANWTEAQIADMNNDGVVNLQDLIKIVVNFSK